MVPAYLTPDQYKQRILFPLGDVTNAMERTGCPVSLDALRDIASSARAEEARLLADLNGWAGKEVNWASWQQLAKFLHTDKAGEGGLELEPSPWWKKGEVAIDEGEIKTDDKALEWLAASNPDHRVGLANIRLLRGVQRAANYAEDWLEKALPREDGTFRLHPSFGLGSDHDTRPGAVTGRFAVKNPPLNQVPRAGEGPMGRLREAFVPPPGMRLVVVDYSQLEVIVLAHLAAVLFGRNILAGRLWDMARAPAGPARDALDLHSLTARYVFGERLGNPECLVTADKFKSDKKLKPRRNQVKGIRYGLNYGKGRRGFATTMFNPDGSALGEQAAGDLIEGLFEFDPEVPLYQAFVREWITQHGAIMSLMGRLCWLPGAKARKEGERNRAWRQALNYPMQASGQEIMALALLAIHQDPVLRDLGYVLSLVVHDEVVGWAPEGNAERCLARVTELMETVMALLAPLMAEGHTGANWSDAK